VLSTPPTVDESLRSLAKACRKPLSDADPVLPPSALTSVLKLVRSAVSAELTVLLVVEPGLPVVDAVLEVLVLEVLDKD
jgi:hypothetical protein